MLHVALDYAIYTSTRDPPLAVVVVVLAAIAACTVLASVCPCFQFTIARARPSVRACQSGTLFERTRSRVVLRHERRQPHQGRRGRRHDADAGGLLLRQGVGVRESAQREEPAGLADAARESGGLGAEPRVLAAHGEVVPRQRLQPGLQLLLLGAEPRRGLPELLQPLLLPRARPLRRQPVRHLATLTTEPLLLLLRVRVRVRVRVRAVPRRLGLLHHRRGRGRGRPRRRHHLVQARARLGPPRREPARDNVHGAVAGRRRKVKGVLHRQHDLLLLVDRSPTVAVRSTSTRARTTTYSQFQN